MSARGALFSKQPPKDTEESVAWRFLLHLGKLVTAETFDSCNLKTEAAAVRESLPVMFRGSSIHDLMKNISWQAFVVDTGRPWAAQRSS
eukprot:923399-Prorocentrum_minimum.AAC.4